MFVPVGAWTRMQRNMQVPFLVPTPLSAPYIWFGTYRVALPRSGERI